MASCISARACWRSRAFVFGLVLWFATGNVIAPPALWLLSAALAALMDHGEIPHHAAVAVPLGVAAAAVVVFALHGGQARA